MTPDETEKWLSANPLRKWREAQDPVVTQADAARRLGCSPSTIRLWEQGGLPNWSFAARLSKLLGYESSDTMHHAWVRWQRKVIPPKPLEEQQKGAAA